MIVFDIACASGHRFEGWFSSSEDFASQRERSLIACPACGSESIERVPSATRINTGVPAPAERTPSPENRGVTTQAPVPSEVQPTPEMMRALYAHVVEQVLLKTENVGREFASEARKIHYNETEARPIRGVATKEEHDELVDEGIPVARLPIPPTDQWN